MHLLTTTRDHLLAPLTAVNGVIEKRQTMPILSNVLIEKQAQQLTMLATDIEIQIKTAISIDSDASDVSTTVPARKFYDILRALPEACEVDLQLEDNRLILKSGKSRFVLQTLPAKDYPKISLPEQDVLRISMPQRLLKQQLAKVAYAMAQQDIRYYLNGLLLVIDGTQIRTVATDGHRLAFASSNIQNDIERKDVILPRKTVMELLRQLSDSDDPIEIIVASNQAVFRFSSVELVSKLIDGKFPDYEKVIPQGYPHQIVFDRLSLLSALQRVAILSNEKFRGVKMLLSKGQLCMSSTNNEQEEAVEELEVNYDGENIDVGFNVVYLLDVLTNCSDPLIIWHFKDSTKGVLITLSNNDDFKYVVMPMRI